MEEIAGLKGKVALVTGGASGIGRAAATLLASDGVRVGLLDRDWRGLEATVLRVTESQGEAAAFEADISKPDEVRMAIARLSELWGRLDIVFANAGINGVWAPFEEIEPDEFRRTIDTNLFGTFNTLRYAVPLLKERGGAVVLTSSINGVRSFSNAGATAYACSKAGIVALAKMSALELAAFKIRVNVICPGLVRTEILGKSEARNRSKAGYPVEYPKGKIPLTQGEALSPDQVARLVRFLVSDDAAQISGTEVFIDGGESLLVG